ncbi:hypothetical protein Mgra_00000531 [Meloidogyne graminicola]|uniref:Uncharacterized protein n=1 Tax=Meloidogyne graminicola TaxID=189291 RepID=A0A8T0A2L9_9BILA|nr:hypothetical protein Mgra_00000531 [Meloidogyne graminicola]
MKFEMDIHKLDKRVKNELISLEKLLHPECKEPVIKKLNELAPPIFHLRIFIGSWRPLRRYNCLVDRDGQEVNIKTRLSPRIINYIVDYYKVDESMLKFKQKGLKFSNFVDRFWIRYFRFKRSFLDRAFLDWLIIK